MSLNLSASNEQLRTGFLALSSRLDVAKLLEVAEHQLNFYLYSRPRKNVPDKYTVFRIQKKNGGQRTIFAPNPGLKIIQQKLNQVLQILYEPKPTVYGFAQGRNIVQNARLHEKAKYVLNLDLEEFFPSINFGRVRGMFMAYPYNLPADVATVLAQICCFNNQLPQGAPTSPIISNMICAKLDNQLQYLAARNKCLYSRYADDITFSTRVRNFPRNLAHIVTDSSGEHPQIGHDLFDLISANGFRINAEKVRLQPTTRHQEVTGLTTNQYPNVSRRYIRQIRAMLHAWDKFGLEAAERDFAAKYDHKRRGPYKTQPTFKDTLAGKIAFLGMVRGKDSRAYLAFKAKLSALDPASQEQQHKIEETVLFISHSSKDDTFVNRLVLDLKITGFQTWVDHRDNVGAGPWDDNIQAALDRCHKLVFVASEDSLQSHECHLEWNYLLKKKPIVIVLLTSSIEKEIPYRLHLSQYIPVHADYANGLGKLIRALAN